MSNLEIYCVTDKEVPFLEESNYKLAGVGRKKFSDKYLKCDYKDNIFYKEKNYSELTFHYWFWKNQLNFSDNDDWIGFCQKRRFWLKENPKKEIKNILDLKENILRTIPKAWESYDAFLCEPINVSPLKKMKLIKRGWKNLIKDPSILFNVKKQNLMLQFDIFHGHGILQKAISVMKINHREKFRSYLINNNNVRLTNAI